MSPIVHIVNAGSAETESLANVTVITTNATPPAPTNSINIAIALNATKYYRAIDIKKMDFHDTCQSFLVDLVYGFFQFNCILFLFVIYFFKYTGDT